LEFFFVAQSEQVSKHFLEDLEKTLDISEGRRF